MLRDSGDEVRRFLSYFLAVLAALLGIVYSVFPSAPSIVGSFPPRDLFAAYLLFFMTYSGVAYASILRGRPGARNLVYGSSALISILLAFEFVLAVFELISDLSLLAFTSGFLAIFAVVLAVFFRPYYIQVRIVESTSRPGSNA